MNKYDLVLFDRDNTLVRDDVGHVHKLEDFAWMPTARDSLVFCKSLGLKVAVVTNQSGVAKGLYDLSQVNDFHSHLNSNLPENSKIDRFYICPHHPEGTVSRYSIECSCRKPQAALILEALREFGVNKARAVFFGDSEVDLYAGNRVGVKTILVKSDLLSCVKEVLCN